MFCVEVVSVEADAVVTLVVTGVLSVDGNSVENTVGAVVLSVNLQLQKRITALTLSYFGCICVDSSTVNSIS